MKHYHVAAGILINKNEILCMKKGKTKYDYISYKFEFPGGKVEVGETPENCLERELYEEMNIHVQVYKEQFFHTVEYEYPDFRITMDSYIIQVNSREFVRKEHISHKWLKPNELLTLDWALADKPIVDKLIKKFN